jgi:hypothetical protein
MSLKSNLLKRIVPCKVYIPLLGGDYRAWYFKNSKLTIQNSKLLLNLHRLQPQTICYN